MVEPTPLDSSVVIQPLAAGTVLADDYSIVAALDTDTSSILYEAEDLHLGIPVCIRECIPPSAKLRADDGSLTFDADGDASSAKEGIERFVREARALVRFHHPNVVRAHRVLETNGTAYIILDYENTTSLRAWLDELGRPPTQTELDRIVGRLLEALDVVHSAGVLHRDIRPENILIRSDLSPVLTGFGNAVIGDAQKPSGSTGALFESEYLAPEVAASPDTTTPARSSDIYGLAATLYCAVTGTLPPRGTSRTVKDTLVPAENLAKESYRKSFLAAIGAALAMQPNERPANVAAWLRIDTPIDPALVSAASQDTVAPSRASEPATPDLPVDAVSADTGDSLTTRLATRVLSSLDTLPDPGEYAPALFARSYLPVAIACAFFGTSLYGAGWSIAVSAILQVLSIALLTAGGCLELYRFNMSLNRKPPSDIAERAANVTSKTAVLASAVLGILALNPIFASRYLSANPDAPVEALSFIVGLPATALLIVAVSATQITGLGRWLFGFVNLVAIGFSLFLLALYLYVLIAQDTGRLGATSLANTYVFILAPACVSVLCIFILLTRLNAIRAHRRSSAAGG